MKILKKDTITFKIIKFIQSFFSHKISIDIEAEGNAFFEKKGF